jgi:hypothetical protein
MRAYPLVLGAIAALGLAAASPLAQTPAADARIAPDPREIPVPRIATRLGTLAGVNELPTRPAPPDVLTMNDGTRVTTPHQWPARRQEMRRILSYYAVGQMPPSPGNVKGRELRSELVLDGTVRYRLVRLTFGPGSRLGLDIGVFTPVTGGPFPAVILQGGTPPGGTVLPRLPHGPNQGRGENVLLLVGPWPPAAGGASTSTAPAGGGRAAAGPPTVVLAQPAPVPGPSGPVAVRSALVPGARGAARPAYTLLGATDRLGVHFARHGHAFTPDDWTALLDFFDMHQRGTSTERRFDRFPTEQELDAALQRPAGR